MEIAVRWDKWNGKIYFVRFFYSLRLILTIFYVYLLENMIIPIFC